VRRLDARKAKFKSNRSKAPMQQFRLRAGGGTIRPTCRCTALPPSIWATSKAMRSPTSSTRWTSPPLRRTYLSLFDQIWNDPEKLEDVTAQICDHIASVYQENSPERIYFLMLYNIFNEFLDDIDEDVLPNDRTGYQDTLIWNKLFNYQRDAATGIINKLETYSGCILADSVGLGKTFTALAVIKYYELRNRRCWCCAPRSWRTTGSTTTATSRPTSSPRTGSTTTCCATPTSAAPAASRSARR
jgi:hypothetical protein